MAAPYEESSRSRRNTPRSTSCSKSPRTGALLLNHIVGDITTPRASMSAVEVHQQGWNLLILTRGGLTSFVWPTCPRGQQPQPHSSLALAKQAATTLSCYEQSTPPLFKIKSVILTD